MESSFYEIWLDIAGEPFPITIVAEPGIIDNELLKKLALEDLVKGICIENGFKFDNLFQIKN